MAKEEGWEIRTLMATPTFGNLLHAAGVCGERLSVKGWPVLERLVS